MIAETIEKYKKLQEKLKEYPEAENAIALYAWITASTYGYNLELFLTKEETEIALKILLKENLIKKNNLT